MKRQTGDKKSRSSIGNKIRSVFEFLFVKDFTLASNREKGNYKVVEQKRKKTVVTRIIDVVTLAVLVWLVVTVNSWREEIDKCDDCIAYCNEKMRKNFMTDDFKLNLTGDGNWTIPTISGS